MEPVGRKPGGAPYPLAQCLRIVLAESVAPDIEDAMVRSAEHYAVHSSILVPPDVRVSVRATGPGMKMAKGATGVWP